MLANGDMVQIGKFSTAVSDRRQHPATLTASPGSSSLTVAADSGPVSGDLGWLVHPRGRRCGAWFGVVSSHPIDLPQNGMSSCSGDNNPCVPDAQGATLSFERESLAK